MKPQSYRDSEAHHTIGSNTVESRFIRERGMHAVNARPPPAVAYRRYPSLSDDGQPWFPRLRRARRNADENVSVVNRANENDVSPLFSVRVVAFLLLVAIIAALAAKK